MDIPALMVGFVLVSDPDVPSRGSVALTLVLLGHCLRKPVCFLNAGRLRICSRVPGIS